MVDQYQNLDILIIDDDDDDIFLIQDTLSEVVEVNFNVRFANSVPEGLEQLGLQHYDVVLCDLVLGRSSGIDFIENARAQGFEVPVIMLTGTGGRHIDQAALDAGASDFLSKISLGPELLDRTIRYAITNFQRQQLLKAIINNANAAIMATDEGGNSILWNHQFGRLVMAYSGTDTNEARWALRDAIQTNRHGDLEIGGNTYDVHISDLPDGGSIYALHDVTERVQAFEERREAERRIFHLAMHDTLTGLPNRSAFTVRLNDEMLKAQDYGNEFYLLLLDLDRFKEVNDVFGHGTGDKLLEEVALRLKSALREGEFLARLGGDEFVAIQRRTTKFEDAPSLAERFCEQLNKPLDVIGKSLASSISVGAAIYPQNGEDLETLLSNADAAMYRAKTRIGSSVEIFDKELDESIRRRSLLANDLRHTISAFGIDVFLQPQAAIASGKVIGFEALARWKHRKFGYVSPTEFIPIAEENGLILDLGEQVLKKACEVAAQWPNDYTIAVNVSPMQLKHCDLPRLVATTLADTGLRAEQLELEVTESLFIDDFAEAASVLNMLKAQGVSIAMDDFGTGYSSLRSLTAFPFDKVKIDASFTARIGQCTKTEEILRSVIDLSSELEFDVLVEGVETAEHVEFLRQKNCRSIQGFFVGEPFDNALTDEWLEGNVKALKNIAKFTDGSSEESDSAVIDLNLAKARVKHAS